MQFTTLALSALSVASAMAQTPASGVKVHVVRVGSMNGSLAYFPNNLKAEVGDMIQFQFAPANHTVTQSTFDQPCQPIAMHSNVTGIYSGFMPVAASSTTTPTYTVMVKNKTPMWMYCSQGKHCQNGMTMVVNENTAANATRSLANFQALAKKSTVNLPAASVTGGSSNTTTTTGGSGSGSGSGSSGTGSDSGSSGTGTGSGAGASGTGTASGAKASVTGSSAHHVRAGDAIGLGSLLAVGLAFFL